MQWGTPVEELAPYIDSCLLCGACEPVCPEDISLLGINIRQRRLLNLSRMKQPAWYPNELGTTYDYSPEIMSAKTLLLAGRPIKQHADICNAMIRLLGGSGSATVATDDGADISDALEAGLFVQSERILQFVAGLAKADTLVAAEGLMHRPLKKWLPEKKIMGLGEALLANSSIRLSIRPEDLYIIESRGYHSDHERLVVFYDKLRRETGCSTNLDLQRMAIPTGASSLQGRHDLESAGCLMQARWILHGRKPKRIIVEDFADIEVFRLVTDTPVIHLSMFGIEDDI